MKEATATSRKGSLAERLPAQVRGFFRNWQVLTALALVVFLAAMLSAKWGTPQPQHQITLHQAADTSNLIEVKWLLDHGADVNARDLSETPLIVAAGRGNEEIAQYLVSHGADVNAGRENGRSALVQAICNHHPELAKWLISKGADVNVRDSYGDTVLHYAAHYGNSEVTQLLIAHGASLDARGDCGRTPLYTTLAYRGHSLRDISVAETLLTNGADPNIGAPNDGAFGDARTPMQLAAFLKFPQLEELLKKYGAK